MCLTPFTVKVNMSDYFVQLALEITVCQKIICNTFNVFTKIRGVSKNNVIWRGGGENEGGFQRGYGL